MGCFGRQLLTTLSKLKPIHASASHLRCSLTCTSQKITTCHGDMDHKKCDWSRTFPQASSSFLRCGKFRKTNCRSTPISFSSSRIHSVSVAIVLKFTNKLSTVAYKCHGKLVICNCRTKNAHDSIGQLWWLRHGYGVCSTQKHRLPFSGAEANPKSQSSTLTKSQRGTTCEYGMLEVTVLNLRLSVLLVV